MRNASPAKVSVIVPIYNVEDYIEKCLTSLLTQSFKEIKIYAISDGSTDASMKVVRDFKKRDSRIVCIEKENGGYGSVLESAIQAIDTKYFLICDPDDWLPITAIETLYREATENRLDLVIGDKYNVYQQSGKTVHANVNHGIFQVEPDKVYTKQLNRFCFLDVSPHAKLYKTAIAKNITFPHHVSYTDTVLFLLALQNSNRVKYVQQPLAYYLVDRPGNTYTDQTDRAIVGHIAVWNSIYEQANFSDHKKTYYLTYRLFCDFKAIAQAYSRRKASNFNDDLYQDLLAIHAKLKQLYSQKYFASVIQQLPSHKKKLDIKILLSRSTSLKSYIKASRLLKEDWR